MAHFPATSQDATSPICADRSCFAQPLQLAMTAHVRLRDNAAGALKVARRVVWLDTMAGQR